MAETRRVDPRLLQAWAEIAPALAEKIRRDIVDEFRASEAAKLGWPRVLIALRRGEKPGPWLTAAWIRHNKIADFLVDRTMYWLRWGGLLAPSIDAQGKQHLQWLDPVTPKQVEAHSIAQYWHSKFLKEENNTRYALYELIPFKDDPFVSAILREGHAGEPGEPVETVGIEKEFLLKLVARYQEEEGRRIPERGPPPRALPQQQSLPNLSTTQQEHSRQDQSNPPQQRMRKLGETQTNKTIPFRKRPKKTSSSTKSTVQKKDT